MTLNANNKSGQYLEKLKLTAELWQAKVDSLPGDSISVNDPRYRMSVSASNTYAAAKTMQKYMTEENAVKQHDTFYEFSDGYSFNIESHEQAGLTDEEFANKFFIVVSKQICFSDCGGYEVTRIVYKGQIVNYVGWQPDMVYEYQYSNGETVWEGSFPHWDH